MFPQGLIDQWLSKSREGRRSVQEDPKATPAILDNIRRLEVYCQEHPYEVFCASSLPSPPFALHALESAEKEQQRLSHPPAVFAATDTAAGIGGRYADKEEVRSSTAAAASHLRDVTARLAAYLQSRVGGERNAERADRVAQLVARVVAEAAVAAAVRLGVAEQVEAEEQAAFRRRQSRRRLPLQVPEKSGAGAPVQTITSRDAAENDGRSGDDGEEHLVAAARTVADDRRWHQALLTMAGLLHNTSAAGTNVDDEERAAEGFAATKRARDSGASADAVPRAGERGDSVTGWARLREEELRRRFGENVPPMPRVTPAAKSQESVDAATPLTTAGGWTALQLQITERDVFFALQKVLAVSAA